MNTEIILALITILSTIVSAVIVRIKAKRENKQQEQEHLFKQSDELVQILKARETQQAENINKILTKLDNMDEELKKLNTKLISHCKIENAIDKALLNNLKGIKPDGDIKYAEHLINEEEGIFMFGG